MMEQPAKSLKTRLGRHFQGRNSHYASPRAKAGPMDAPVGAGVHICTGPIYVRGAQFGDILEVRILDMYPRACANPEYKNRTFGTNLAAN